MALLTCMANSSLCSVVDNLFHLLPNSIVSYLCLGEGTEDRCISDCHNTLSSSRSNVFQAPPFIVHTSYVALIP